MCVNDDSDTTPLISNSSSAANSILNTSESSSVSSTAESADVSSDIVVNSSAADESSDNSFNESSDVSFDESFDESSGDIPDESFDESNNNGSSNSESSSETSSDVPSDPSHTCSFVKVKTTAPTCTAQGYTLYTCTCGKAEKRDKNEALGHSWSDWETVVEPTTTSTGVEQRYCTRSGCDAS